MCHISQPPIGLFARSLKRLSELKIRTQWTVVDGLGVLSGVNTSIGRKVSLLVTSGRFDFSRFNERARWRAYLPTDRTISTSHGRSCLRLRTGGETGFNKAAEFRQEVSHTFAISCSLDREKDCHEQRSQPEERRKEEAHEDPEGKARGKTGQEEGLNFRHKLRCCIPGARTHRVEANPDVARGLSHGGAPNR